MAARLVDAFGDQTLEVLEMFPKLEPIAYDIRPRLAGHGQRNQAGLEPSGIRQD